MEEYELVSAFNKVSSELLGLGYKVSAMHVGFYIHNNKGTIVADCDSIDGVRGFAQGIKYANEFVARSSV